MSIVGKIECNGPAQVFGRIKGELRACPYRKLHPASEQIANRVMLVPDDRLSDIAGICAKQAIPVESTA